MTHRDAFWRHFQFEHSSPSILFFVNFKLRKNAVARHCSSGKAPTTWPQAQMHTSSQVIRFETHLVKNWLCYSKGQHDTQFWITLYKYWYWFATSSFPTGQIIWSWHPQTYAVTRRVHPEVAKTFQNQFRRDCQMHWCMYVFIQINAKAAPATVQCKHFLCTHSLSTLTAKNKWHLDSLAKRPPCNTRTAFLRKMLFTFECFYEMQIFPDSYLEFLSTRLTSCDHMQPVNDNLRPADFLVYSQGLYSKRVKYR